MIGLIPVSGMKYMIMLMTMTIPDDHDHDHDDSDDDHDDDHDDHYHGDDDRDYDDHDDDQALGGRNGPEMGQKQASDISLTMSVWIFGRSNYMFMQNPRPLGP